MADQVAEMKRCPHCAELIQADAKVCRYCGRSTVKPWRPGPILLGIVAIIVLLCIIIDIVVYRTYADINRDLSIMSGASFFCHQELLTANRNSDACTAWSQSFQTNYPDLVATCEYAIDDWDAYANCLGANGAGQYLP